MRICYFGIYDPGFGRNKVYLSGLRALGHEVIECRDDSRGLLKYIRLARRHRAILKAGGYEAMVVGYPGHIVVPLAKALTKKLVVFDALCSLYEGEVISRGKYRFNPFMRAWVRFIDEAAVKAADVVLVETDAQREFFIKRFKLEPGRVFRAFTGADEEAFRPDSLAAKRAAFTAVFRGRFLPEAGVRHVIGAAKILESRGAEVLVIGNGHLGSEVKYLINKSRPANLEWVSGYQPFADLAKRSLECHVALGQFEDHERLERTIPHKAFEALAMGLPYITARARGISEILTDGENCLMVNPADPADLAAKILRLKEDPALAAKLGKNGRALFESRFTAKRLAQDIVRAITSRKFRLNN